MNFSFILLICRRPFETDICCLISFKNIKHFIPHSVYPFLMFRYIYQTMHFPRVRLQIIKLIFIPYSMIVDKFIPVITYSVSCRSVRKGIFPKVLINKCWTSIIYRTPLPIMAKMTVHCRGLQEIQRIWMKTHVIVTVIIG